MAIENKKNLYAKYLEKMDTLLSSPVTTSIHDGFLKANTKVLRLSRYESSAFDTSWISVIEDVLFDLGEIIKAPKLVTVEEGNLVPIELAKKIKGASVQHLASHTQFIKDIDKDNNVIPSKIMSFGNEDWLYTYENRFIATFIRRLMLFIEKRHQFIKEYIPLHKEEAMVIKSKAKIDGADVEIESKIKVTKLSEDEEADAARRAAERVETVRTYIMYYFSSPFMQKMKTERDVRKPILMTNILRKNPRYHHCYEAFVYIDKYDSLGMDYHASEYFHPFSDEDGANLAWLFYSQYLALNDQTDVSTFKTRKKDVHPKVLTSIDDEEFVYGRIPSTRLEFVRIDKEYQDYLDRKAGKKLPEHPKKPELEFYKEEYDARREARSDKKELTKLISRKEKALARFERVVEELIRKREEEEALLRQMEEEERLAEEERILNIKRAEIERDAKGLKVDGKKSEGEFSEEDFDTALPAYSEQPMVVTFSALAKDGATYAKTEEIEDAEKADVIFVSDDESAPIEEVEGEGEEGIASSKDASSTGKEGPKSKLGTKEGEEGSERNPLTLTSATITKAESDALSSLAPRVPLPRKVIVLSHKGRFLRKKREYRDENYGLTPLPMNDLELEELEKKKKEEGISEEEYDIEVVFDDERAAKRASTLEKTKENPAVSASIEEPLPGVIPEEEPASKEEIPAETSPIEENITEDEAVADSEKESEPVPEKPAEPQEKKEESSSIDLEKARQLLIQQALDEAMDEGNIDSLEEEAPISENREEEPVPEESEPEEDATSSGEEEPKEAEATAKEEPVSATPIYLFNDVRASKKKEKEAEEKQSRLPLLSGEETVSLIEGEGEPKPSFGLPSLNEVELRGEKEEKLDTSVELQNKGEVETDSETKKEEEPTTAFVSVPDPSVLDSIPGRFIVKCPEGYYVDDGVFTKNKIGARIFYDFNKALKQKRRYGGKVIKL